MTLKTNALFQTMQRAQELAQRLKQEQKIRELAQKGHDTSRLTKNLGGKSWTRVMFFVFKILSNSCFGHLKGRNLHTLLHSVAGKAELGCSGARNSGSPRLLLALSSAAFPGTWAWCWITAGTAKAQTWCPCGIFLPQEVLPTLLWC